MKNTSKVIMGATLIMVVSLAMVLGLVLVLLAEVYCSLLLGRRQQLRRTSSNITAAATVPDRASEGSPQHQYHSATPSLSSFYAQGVLHAPRSFLFPSIRGNGAVDLEKQHFELPQFYESQVQQSFSSPPFVPLASPKPVHEVPVHCSTSACSDEFYGGSNHNESETYIYICNPIYDNEGCRTNGVDTPFETPDTSPSRLETMGDSSVSGEEDDADVASSSPSSAALMTPPLTPMKKLPAEACPVSLRVARSLATSGSDSNSNNDGNSSSSSSASPRTSPSW